MLLSQVKKLVLAAISPEHHLSPKDLQLPAHQEIHHPDTQLPQHLQAPPNPRSTQQIRILLRRRHIDKQLLVIIPNPDQARGAKTNLLGTVKDEEEVAL